jgi:hypothetical protein
MQIISRRLPRPDVDVTELLETLKQAEAARHRRAGMNPTVAVTVSV